MADINVEQHNLGRSVVLHLFPGVLIAIFFVIAGPLVVAAGYPSTVALMLAFLPVMILVVGYLIYQGRKMHDTNSLEGIVVYREPIPVWQYFALVVPLFLWLGVIFTVSAQLEVQLSDSLFGWLPEWYFFPDFDISDYSSSALLVTVVLLLVLNGIAIPIVEEMYFRGYLLPRISRFGRWAPVINTVLFSIYHFWSPWGLLTRVIGLLPLVSAVYWKRNIYVGMLTHILANLIGSLFTAALIFSQSQ